MDPAEAGQPESHDPPVDGRFVTLGLLFYGVLGALGVVWRVGFYGEPIWYASGAAEAAGFAPLRDLGVGVAAGLALIAVSDWITRKTAWGDRLARNLAEALGRLTVPDALCRRPGRGR